MLIRKPADIPSSEITPESVYLNRRMFIGAVAAGVATTIIPDSVAAAMRQSGRQQGQLEPNTWEHITTYNNFYEFGTGKSDPSRNAQEFKTQPWTITIEGECHRPGAYQLEDFLNPFEVEDRVYRMRCVEAWSMVIPWRGVELNKFIARAQPTANAKYVAFTTLFDPQQMPGQRSPVLEWPYVEGLRMDEAMHPLTLLVTGVHGRALPNQNGAPLRLVVPWKYGFKGIKSIVGIKLVEEMPPTSWSLSASHEYGFYANVNPNVDHPRWSQAYERRLPSTFRDTETLMFNGYADQVGQMYEGMDLRRWY